MRSWASLVSGFLGNSGSQPINSGKPISVSPQASPIIIDWAAQAAAMNALGASPLPAGISVDLKKLYVTTSLEAIKAIYIDNLAGEQTISVRASDTGMVVQCPPGKCGVYQVMTDGAAFTVYVDDIAILRDNARLTRLIFTNISLTSFTY